MVSQICLKYKSLPDYRTLSANEVRFFYANITKYLIEQTKPRKD